MKFRLSAQPKPKEFKSNIPSHLLSDPAFSADPHLNPYSVNNREFAWATPPLGHPVLKNKNRGPAANFASHNGIITTADFDFQLLQPPNSPVPYVQVGGGSHNQDTSSFPFPTSFNTASWGEGPPSPLIASAATASLVPRSPSPVTSTTPTIKLRTSTALLPAKEETKRKRMPFLSRRKSTHTTTSNLATPSTSSVSKQVPAAGNGSRTTSSRTASDPILSVPRDRPVLPPRAATSGTTTPRSTATSISGSSKRLGEGRGSRVNDLDRIDELDETNPWGLSLHHDGPYQAAAQALKRGDDMSLGGAGSSIGDYVPSEMQAYGNAYIPPQAPTGVSLNLSPGQILPRNFGEQRISPPRMRDTSVKPPRMQQAYPQIHPSLSRSQSQLVASPTSSKPPRYLNRLDPRPDVPPEPSRQRRQSQPPPSPAFSVLPNPHPIIPIESVANARPNLVPSISQTPHDLYLRIDPQTAPDQHSQPKSRPNSLYQHSLDSRSDSHSSSDLSRRHSERPRRPFFISNPGPELSPPAVFPRDIKVMEKSKEVQHEDASASVDIGMAMLHSRLESESETLVIPAPRIFLPQGTPDQGEDFNPYDPIHLEKGHSRTPSPSVLIYDNSSHSSHDSSGGKSSVREPSRRPSPVRSLEVPNTAVGRPMRTSEQPVAQMQTPLPSKRDSVDPPPYTLLVPDSIGATLEDHPNTPSGQKASQANATSSSALPERTPLPASSAEPRLSRWERETVMQPAINEETFAMLQRPGAASVVSLPRSTNSASSDNHAPQVQTAEYTIRREEPVPPPGQQVMPMLPARRSRERLAPSVMTAQERDRDARSTNQSFSTGSSGYTRNGPPPRTHMPKRLVMPAPLNVNNNGNGNNISYLNGFASPPRMQPSLPAFQNSHRQVPPRHAQVTFQPQAQVYYPPPIVAAAPNVYIPSPAIKQNKEIAVVTSRKLKKRTSVMPPPAAQIPPAPILSTVSFAAPVIGYGHPMPIDKAVARLKNDKIPKRVLSKQRRTEV